MVEVESGKGPSLPHAAANPARSGCKPRDSGLLVAPAAAAQAGAALSVSWAARPASAGTGARTAVAPVSAKRLGERRVAVLAQPPHQIVAQGQLPDVVEAVTVRLSRRQGGSACSRCWRSCCQDDLETYGTIDSLLRKTEGGLYAGFDMGRTRNTSELIVLEKTAKRVTYRMGKSFDSLAVPAQEAPITC